MKDGKEQLDLGQPSQELPEGIRSELEIADRIPDKEFWTEKNLEYWFGKDDRFGIKLCAGFLEILGGKLKKDSSEYEVFSRIADIVHGRSSSVLEKARAAMRLREFISKTFDVPLGELTARNILTHAYISEAEAMRGAGLNPEHDIPFTLGLRPDDAEQIKSFLSEKLKNTGVETTGAAFQPEIEKLTDAFYESPELFENYVQWLGDVDVIIKKKHPAEIDELLHSINQTEHKKSFDKRDIIVKQIIYIRKMKKFLRQNGITSDVLTDAAFQKWLQGKRPLQKDKDK